MQPSLSPIWFVFTCAVIFRILPQRETSDHLLARTSYQVKISLESNSLFHTVTHLLVVMCQESVPIQKPIINRYCNLLTTLWGQETNMSNKTNRQANKKLQCQTDMVPGPVGPSIWKTCRRCQTAVTKPVSETFNLFVSQVIIQILSPCFQGQQFP